MRERGCGAVVSSDRFFRGTMLRMHAPRASVLRALPLWAGGVCCTLAESASPLEWRDSTPAHACVAVHGWVAVHACVAVHAWVAVHACVAVHAWVPSTWWFPQMAVQPCVISAAVCMATMLFSPFRQACYSRGLFFQCNGVAIWPRCSKRLASARMHARSRGGARAPSAPHKERAMHACACTSRSIVWLRLEPRALEFAAADTA